MFEERATEAPPASAADVSVTVQVEVAADITELGKQDKLETAGGGVTVTVEVALPFNVAVKVTV